MIFDIIKTIMDKYVFVSRERRFGLSAEPNRKDMLWIILTKVGK